jgi:hypothetical protein
MKPYQTLRFAIAAMMDGTSRPLNTFGDRKARVEFTPCQTGANVRATFDSESTYSIEQQRQGWQSILNNFACHVEANRTS